MKRTAVPSLHLNLRSLSECSISDDERNSNSTGTKGKHDCDNAEASSASRSTENSNVIVVDLIKKTQDDSSMKWPEKPIDGDCGSKKRVSSIIVVDFVKDKKIRSDPLYQVS